MIEILVASIGAFGVLAGLAAMYSLALTLYKTSVRQDQRLASSGLVEDLMTQITATCPTDTWRIVQSNTMGQDGSPAWRALCYERLSNHNIRHPPTGAPPFPLQRPFDAFPGGDYYPRNQNSVMDRESGIIYWWRDMGTYHMGQNRYLESKIFHIRFAVQRRDWPLNAGVPNNVLGNSFGQPRNSFSSIPTSNLPALTTWLEGLLADVRFRRVSEVLAEDVLEFRIQPFPSGDGIYWRFDAFRGS